ncbi:MAG: peptidylprolyl isomerase [Paracoccus sp. (in: a-proteobacteria)]|nr:peptidylprolyl isomerase [Paracoccus sp. (in: a-proteobacteria)]
MFNKFFLSAALPAALLAAGPVLAQADGPGPNLVIEVAAHDGTPKGTIVLDLFADKAPNHVERLTTLARDGAYDGVVFHRVIAGFMAQTGDVEHGRRDGDTALAGTGGSDLPDLQAEFNDVSFQAGTVGMARSQHPDSANSQFFIDLAPATFLDGQYTAVGQLIEGMDVLQSIKTGDEAANGAVENPDYMARVTVQD